MAWNKLYFWLNLTEKLRTNLSNIGRIRRPSKSYFQFLMRRFNEPNNRFTFLPKKNYILKANSEFTFLTKKIHLIFNKPDNIEIKQQKRSLHSSISDWNSILVLPACRTIADSMSPRTRSPTNRTDIIVQDRACDTTSIILQPVTQELRVIFAIVKAKLAKPISQVIEHFHACVLTLKLS